MSGFKDNGLEKISSKYHYSSITRKQASCREWTLYNVPQLLNETVQRENSQTLRYILVHVRVQIKSKYSYFSTKCMLFVLKRIISMRQFS